MSDLLLFVLCVSCVSVPLPLLPSLVLNRYFYLVILTNSSIDFLAVHFSVIFLIVSLGVIKYTPLTYLGLFQVNTEERLIKSSNFPLI